MTYTTRKSERLPYFKKRQTNIMSNLRTLMSHLLRMCMRSMGASCSCTVKPKSKYVETNFSKHRLLKMRKNLLKKLKRKTMKIKLLYRSAKSVDKTWNRIPCFLTRATQNATIDMKQSANSSSKLTAWLSLELHFKLALQVLSLSKSSWNKMHQWSKSTSNRQSKEDITYRS